MDKKTMIEKLVRDAHEKAGFTGTWLYAEKGEIVSSGAIGINDLEKGTPISEDLLQILSRMLLRRALSCCAGREVGPLISAEGMDGL